VSILSKASDVTETVTGSTPENLVEKTLKNFHLLQWSQ